MCAGDAEVRATCGPFSVQVFASKQHLLGGRCCYPVRVAGADGAHWLERNFDDFACLRDSLGDRSQELPKMPQKSTVRQRLFAGFRESQHSEIRDIAVAAVTTDPLALTPGVRTFLGLNAMTTEQAASMQDFRRFLLLTEVSFRTIAEIEESEEEEDHDDEEEGCSEASMFTSCLESEGSDDGAGAVPVRAVNRVVGKEDSDMGFDALLVTRAHGVLDQAEQESNFDLGAVRMKAADRIFDEEEEDSDTDLDAMPVRAANRIFDEDEEESDTDLDALPVRAANRIFDEDEDSDTDEDDLPVRAVNRICDGSDEEPDADLGAMPLTTVDSFLDDEHADVDLEAMPMRALHRICDAESDMKEVIDKPTNVANHFFFGHFV